MKPSDQSSVTSRESRKMSEPTTGKCYDIWSGIYDHTFGALVHRRQIRALEQLRPEPGQRVLDLGVGTGMTLRHYPRNITVVGMDLSGGMLAKAAHKVREDRLTHTRLVQADAMRPPFADNSFDHIMVTHTISVVSDPGKLLHWAHRMLRPGGRIVLLNHFHSTQPVVGWFERVLNPMFVKIGWRSDLSLEDCLQGQDLHVQYQFKMATVDLWQIVVLTEHQPGVSRGNHASQSAQPENPSAAVGSPGFSS